MGSMAAAAAEGLRAAEGRSRELEGALAESVAETARLRGVAAAQAERILHRETESELPVMRLEGTLPVSAGSMVHPFEEGREDPGTVGYEGLSQQLAEQNLTLEAALAELRQKGDHLKDLETTMDQLREYHAVEINEAEARSAIASEVSDLFVFGPLSFFHQFAVSAGSQSRARLHTIHRCQRFSKCIVVFDAILGKVVSFLLIVQEYIRKVVARRFATTQHIATLLF